MNLILFSTENKKGERGKKEEKYLKVEKFIIILQIVIWEAFLLKLVLEVDLI